jgi:hypothetical protein
VLAALAALALVVLVARRWRRGGAGAGDDPDAEPALSDDDAQRLDAELAAFDR